MNPAFRAGTSPAPAPTPGRPRPSEDSARPVMADPAPPASSGPSLCCDRCGCPPGDPLQQILMSAVWLVDGPAGPTTACYCRACAPAGPITDLTCLRCGDGPLLVGDLAADPDGAVPEPAREWLTAAGWHLDEPLCPGCRPAGRAAAPRTTR